MIQWNSSSTLNSKTYTCGYCGKFVASEKGYSAHHQPTGQPFGIIYICHFCLKPTFIDASGVQTPGSSFGDAITGIDDKKVETLFDEARRCMSVSAFTAIVLCCRKLLMHVAVSKGAGEGLRFIEYVEYLSNNNYIPPGAKDWVDTIRTKGNEANHEIVVMDKESAEDLLSFSGMLLKIVYEFPSKVKKKITPPITTPNA